MTRTPRPVGAPPGQAGERGTLLAQAVEKGQAAVRDYDAVQIGCDDPDNRRHQEVKLAPQLAEALRDVLEHVGRRRKQV